MMSRSSVRPVALLFALLSGEVRAAEPPLEPAQRPTMARSPEVQEPEVAAAANRIAAPTGAATQDRILGADAEGARWERTLEQRKDALVERHVRRGSRLSAERQHELSVKELALAYALSPSPSRLAGLAYAMRRADQDREALLIYRRLLQEEPRQALREEFAEAVALLRAKLGEDGDDPFESAALLRVTQERAHVLCQQASFSACGALYAVAYALKALPRLLFNIAQANRRAGILDESTLFYRRFQQESPPSPLRREASQYVLELRAEAFRQPLYKRGWLWGAVLGGAAAITAATVTAAVTGRRSDPQTDLGTKDVRFSLSF